MAAEQLAGKGEPKWKAIVAITGGIAALITAAAVIIPVIRDGKPEPDEPILDLNEAEALASKWVDAWNKGAVDELTGLSADPFYVDDKVLVGPESIKGKYEDLLGGSGRRTGVLNPQAVQSKRVAELKREGGEAREAGGWGSVRVEDEDVAVLLEVHTDTLQKEQLTLLFRRPDAGSALRLFSVWGLKAGSEGVAKVSPKEKEFLEDILYYKAKLASWPQKNVSGVKVREALTPALDWVKSNPDFLQRNPDAAADLFQSLGGAYLVAMEGHPFTSIEDSLPYLTRSLEIDAHRDLLKDSVSYFKSILSKRSMDLKDYITAMLHILRGDDPAIPDLAEELVRIFQKPEFLARKWLLEEATRKPLGPRLEWLKITLKRENSIEAEVEITTKTLETGLVEVTAKVGPNLFGWKVDGEALRYRSLNEETERFMLEDVIAVPSTFSANFAETGKNEPLQEFVSGKEHSYTNYAMTWWLEEAVPASLKATLSAMFATKEERERMKAGEPVESTMKFELKWINSETLEVKANPQGDFGFGPQDFSLVWQVTPTKKQYVSVSRDAKNLDLLSK